ncbi:branched-chain amino acid ABC transporter permease [Paraburkholderia unamae]|uniref:Amino acid/amide ABC transporter membrane protein 2 (HAAT family) n=1 Tax=Paraburkholderia unamae TaxID=219649 RepID=A0ABX5KLG9_9BURK|nr:branched-chain amino acid ABC transporter permease [Paraburkholderia unamae]PVX82754.1 amino acid/amide ABC transporter membrane protein 2 (HAAT family) [Paraburkholderia unamae]CAG9269395.1 ABC-type branched-chain amino acid transport system, permease component [Paraburkholderia unamae]
MYSFLLHVATLTCIYALLALGLNLQAGFTGLLNFGFVAFAGVGAYASAITSSLGYPVPVGMLAGVAVAMLVGYVMARLGRNLASDYWAIATLAVAELIRTVALNENWLTGGAQGISGVPAIFGSKAGTQYDLAFFLLALAMVVMAFFACTRLTRGRFGRAIRLMREEPALATSLGYQLVPLKVKATVTSAAMASVGGSLLAHYMSFVGPDYMLSSETFLVWTMVMIGGLGNNVGVILGALLVEAVYSAVPFVKDYLDISSDIAGAVRLGTIGVVLLICLMVRPGGLVPEKIRSAT